MMRSRWVIVVMSGGSTRPPSDTRAKVSKKRSMSAAFSGHNLDCGRCRCRVCGAHEVVIDRALGVSYQGSARKTWRDLLEQSEPLTNDTLLIVQQTGHIAAWPR